MISKEKIQEILDNVDIVDLVSSYTDLKKRGKNYFGLCPFPGHDENTPSLSVNPAKGLAKCMGCDEGGNAINFLMKVDGLKFPEAAVKLAERYNVDMTKEPTLRTKSIHEEQEKTVSKKLDDRCRTLNNDVEKYFKSNLNKGDKDGSMAMNYLMGERGLSKETIEFFGIGLAPTESVVTKVARNNRNEYLNAGIELGLVSKTDNGHTFDTFRNRIMFPIKGATGEVIGFSSRSYTDKDKHIKYMNSKESYMFKKSNTIYNLNNIIHEEEKIETAILFEGFMDVIAAHQAGIRNGIATMGTAVTKEHVKMIKEHFNGVTICFDGDASGVKAAAKAEEMLRNEEIVTRVITIPEGLDPDEYIKKYSSKDFINLLRGDEKASIDVYRDEMNTVYRVIKDLGYTIIESIDNPSNRILYFKGTEPDGKTIIERKLIQNKKSGKYIEYAKEPEDTYYEDTPWEFDDLEDVFGYYGQDMEKNTSFLNKIYNVNKSEETRLYFSQENAAVQVNKSDVLVNEQILVSNPSEDMSAFVKELKIEESYDFLKESLGKIKAKEDFTKLLESMGDFYDYSFTNLGLIYSQMPSAKQVAGFNKWKEKGRSVKSGSRSIRIIAPIIKDVEVKYPDGSVKTEKKPVGFKKIPVFDISQTQELEKAKEVSKDIDADLIYQELKLKYSISERPLTEIRDNASGYFEISTGKIVVAADFTSKEKITIALHEIAHSKMHASKNCLKYTEQEREVQAEAVAFVVGRKLGVESKDMSVNYIDGWAKDSDVFLEHAKLIKNTSAEILIENKALFKEIERDLDKCKKKSKEEHCKTR